MSDICGPLGMARFRIKQPGGVGLVKGAAITIKSKNENKNKETDSAGAGVLPVIYDGEVGIGHLWSPWHGVLRIAAGVVLDICGHLGMESFRLCKGEYMRTRIKRSAGAGVVHYLCCLMEMVSDVWGHLEIKLFRVKIGENSL